jgi:hypothetical protein
LQQQLTDTVWGTNQGEYETGKLPEQTNNYTIAGKLIERIEYIYH